MHPQTTNRRGRAGRAAKAAPVGTRHRRGAALLLALFLTVCLGALAVSSMVMASSSTMVTKYYDRERDFRYAAEAGLALGRSRFLKDTSIHLPDSGYVKLLDSVTVSDARNVVLPRTRVTVYAGRSGNVTGQFGDFVTLIAKADDGRSTRYVRRLELVAENFARFAMFTNTWQGGLCYTTGEFIRGIGWSNQQWQSCNSPTYFDTIGAVGTITGGSPIWKKANSAKPNQSPIPLPTVSRLANLPGYAAAAGLSFTPPSGRALRMEFVAADVDANGDSTGTNEGFLRVFRANSTGNAPSLVRLPVWDANGTTKPPVTADSVCGDFHYGKFYPIVVHKTQWFRDTVGLKVGSSYTRLPLPADTGKIRVTPSTPTDSLNDAERDRVMNSNTARCYLAGSPQLAAVERVAGQPNGNGGNWTASDALKGGEDTTFTPTGRWGDWIALTDTMATLVRNSTHTRNSAKWLFPIGRSYNSNFKGVVYVNGDILVSGLLRSRLTLYAAGQVTFVDDLVYVTPPNSPGADCFAANANMLGIIAVDSIMIDQNVMHRPQRATRTTTSVKYLNGSGNNFRLHGVLMSLTKTVGVYGFDKGPAIAGTTDCLGATFSGGCIAQVGGVIEQAISATLSGANTGFAENRQVDQCMSVTSPPYFPTTGRYFNNRYFEFDPARFDPVQMYRTLQSGM